MTVSCTHTQGQYLAFIYAYTTLNGRPPAEADFQEFFRVSPPSVHKMVLQLEKHGFIRRIPRVSRSIALLLAPAELPLLLPADTAGAARDWLPESPQHAAKAKRKR